MFPVIFTPYPAASILFIWLPMFRTLKVLWGPPIDNTENFA